MNWVWLLPLVAMVVLPVANHIWPRWWHGYCHFLCEPDLYNVDVSKEIKEAILRHRASCRREHTPIHTWPVRCRWYPDG